MGSLTVMMMATPIFGLSLTPPSVPLLSVTPTLTLFQDAEVAASSDEEEPQSDDATYSRELRERAETASLHRTLGIVTWASMTVTVAMGVIQYHNLYGFFADRDSNPCVTGDAIFGQEQCSGVPYLHLASALITTGLYSATFTLSLMMPDPDDSSEGESEFASTLRTHKLLRWVHFGGMIAQSLLGFFIANSELFGMDRANDYGTLQALATLHGGIGLVTYGALTWAGALMTF